MESIVCFTFIHIAHSLTMLSTTNTGFSHWSFFTDQNSKPFDIEDNVKMTLIIK